MDILSEICARKREHVHLQKKERRENALLAEAKDALPPRGFQAALERKVQAGGFGLIAEIKKASPSKGIIRADFHPMRLAEAYAKGGAACLSVLTDKPYFQGMDAYLGEARSACDLPVLRKDFMLDPYQIIESRALAADCALLIMAALSDAQAAELLHASQSLGMDALIEVHDARELERAGTHLPGATMIGINNRSLATFEVSLEVSESLAKRLPKGVLGISESGIFTHEDMQRLSESDIHCFLVGESLMREKDVEAATRKLLSSRGVSQ